MHSKNWSKKQNWKTIGGNHVAFGENGEIVAPGFYKGWREKQEDMIIDGKVVKKAPRHREAKMGSNILSEPIKPLRKPKMSREELRKFLVNQDSDITKDSFKNLYFDFPNPHNLIFTVYYNMARGNAIHKDFDNPTKAFQFWIKTPIRQNSTSFISARPQKSDSFPQNFHASGYPFQIALRYIEYLEKTEDWVKFLEEAHPEDLK
ncbi:MAG: hypothetical protein WC623_22515 [Pedobacter sp.]|uniref:hypothetical protein n=1 Tax=Pedobacter sp. TaxID=1411316 RepID=UPI003562EC93